MKEEKLIKVLKQLTTLVNLQDKKNGNIDLRLNNLQKQIEELTKQVNHLRINQVVKPDKKIKIPKVIK